MVAMAAMMRRSVRCLRHLAQKIYRLTRPYKLQIPSGKRLQNYGKSPFVMGKSTINGPFMAIFDSYVKLPEGTSTILKYIKIKTKKRTKTNRLMYFIVRGLFNLSDLT